MSHTRVITRSGATPSKVIGFIESYPNVVRGYKVIILHLGTNWLSGKLEWGLYLRMANKEITKEDYKNEIVSFNPPPANGPAETFREQFQELIDLIKRLNPTCKILISSIIPRLWDNDRRHLVRQSYNRILEKFGSQERVSFIRSYQPFFDNKRRLKAHLFIWDGLHLSNSGAVVLRSVFCVSIYKALNDLLYY